MRRTLCTLALILLAIGIAYGNSAITVNFPSDNSYYCSASNGCDFIGNNGVLTASMWTTGDYVTETFVTGQPFVNELTVNFGAVDNYGTPFDGVPGLTYENDVYINGVEVGMFELEDCSFCRTLVNIYGTVDFDPIYGSGTYTVSILLAQTADDGYGSQWFSIDNGLGEDSTVTLSSIPEPGSILLLGSGVLGIAGVLRRKLNW